MESYKNLSTYILATVIFDLTVEFCRRWIDPISRTTDQMTQAARSGKQNIAEGASVQSLESYIKLLGVTEGSQRELAADYEDFLRQRKLPIWDKDDVRTRRVREFRAVWTRPNQPNTPNLPSSPEVAANTLLTFCQMETFLLKRQIEALKEKFVREGGFRENLFAKRLAFRRNSTPLTNLTRLTKLILVILVLLGMTTKSAFATNSGPFSVDVWVYPTTSAATKALVAKAEELRLVTDASGNPACQIKVTTWQTAATSSVALSLNTWNHVSCTYDKVTLRVFVNGIQTAQTSLTSPPDDTANVFRIGQDDSASTTYTNFAGTVDDFKFYNYARTQKQIIEDMLGSPKLASGGGAVGYWKFDEGADNTCSGGTNDACNSGNGGSTLDGPQSGMAVPATATSGWTNSGKFNKALLFDGSNDYIAMGSDVTALKITSNIALSAWIYLTNTSSQHDIICKYTGTAATSAYCLNVSSAGKLVMQVVNATGPAVVTTTSNTTLLASTWYHVVGVFNSAQNITLYINGTQDVVNTTSIPTTLQDPTTVLDIGAENAGSNLFIGTIDEPKIYNYALTSDEIKLDYNRGSALVMGSLGDNSSYQKQAANQEYCVPGDTTSCVSPVGEWKFEEGSGASALDSSGGNGTGTITGTTYVSGKVGKALNFNGSTDTVTVSNSLSTKSVEFWVYPTTTTQNLIDLRTAATAASISVSGGTIAATGFTSPTIYVNGVISSTLAANTWQYVTVTTGTAITANAIRFGRISTTSLTGKLDAIRIFDYARTSAQIAWDYNRGGPVAQYKFDECTGATANDASGNGNNGTITIGASGSQTSTGTCGTSTTTEAWNNGTTGKRNASINLDGNDDYVSTSAFSPLATAAVTTTKASWGGWFYPTSSAASLTLMEKASEFRLTTDANSKPVCSIGNDTTQTLTLQPDAAAGKDNFINNNTPTFNQGVSIYVAPGEDNTNSNYVARELIQFDLSSIPAGSTVTSAVMTFVESTISRHTNDRVFRIYRMLRAWVEGTANNTASGDGATWDTYDGVSNWQTAGAAGANDRESTDIGNANVPTSLTSGQTQDFTLTASKVQEWISGALTNNGVLIQADTETDERHAFYSSDATTGSNRPKLVVNYNTAHNATAGSTALTLSAWNHVMCTYDGANIKTYLNGSLVGTTAETNNITAASSILYMGENSSSAQRVTGQLDDIRVYSYPLTATQIKLLMNEGAVRFGPGTGSP